jgi:hypothetical protein
MARPWAQRSESHEGKSLAEQRRPAADRGSFRGRCLSVTLCLTTHVLAANQQWRAVQ